MKKRIELIKPIQDKVFEAIKRIAESRQFDAIVDVSNNPTIVYYSPKVDITEEVLKQLGIVRTNF
jgi:outer membrane protein